MTDLISSLPDEVLGHILSFLTTKEAALTSILAKRWRNLLAFVPIIDIDDSVFLFPEEGKRRREGILQSFMDFVDRVLALQGDSSIKKVSLYCTFRVDSDRVDRWIRNVMQRGVSNLNLCVDFGWNYRLPLEIFKSRTLVKLGLGGIVKLDGWDGDGVIFLPMLKTLDLDTVEICMDQFQILLRACPVLKKLEMFNVEWIDRMQTMSSASLKRQKQLLVFQNILQLFSLCSEAMPVFNNLTFLAVRSHKDWGWQAMPVPLKSCPHLKTLSLRGLLHYETDKCGDACDCISREEKVCSLSSCPVKRLDIKGFGETDRELKMIKHFLESFPCLEEMEIHAERKDFDIPGRLEAVREQLIAYNELTTCAVQFKWTAQ